jgi:cyanophycinase-like exopeptidase
MTRLQKAVDGMGGNRIGLGLSEDAAAIIRKNSIDIIGSGNVTLIVSDGHKVLRPGDTFRI